LRARTTGAHALELRHVFARIILIPRQLLPDGSYGTYILNCSRTTRATVSATCPREPTGPIPNLRAATRKRSKAPLKSASSLTVQYLDTPVPLDDALDAACLAPIPYPKRINLWG